MEDKDDITYKAKLAEQAERYDEMVNVMKGIAQSKETLSTEERNLLSVAYKNVIGTRRASWRVLSSLEERLTQDKKGGDSDSKNSSRKEIIQKYREVVEKELHDICEDILELLTEHLIKKCEEGNKDTDKSQRSDESGTDKEHVESQVFYHKMKGDYLRYKAEFSTEKARNDAAEESLREYKTASDLALEALPPTHPIRLGLALNFSVFYYEILNSPDRACSLAKRAFDDAIANVKEIQEASYKDSTLIMQLLRDNLTLWTSDMQEEEGDKYDTTIQDLEDPDAP